MRSGVNVGGCFGFSIITMQSNIKRRSNDRTAYAHRGREPQRGPPIYLTAQAPALRGRGEVDGKFSKLPVLPAVDRGGRDQDISPGTDEILLRLGLGVCLVLPPHRNVVRG